MDPIGFGLENFDAVGRYPDRRTSANPSTPPESCRAGRSSTVPDELRARCMMKEREQFAYNLTERMLGYALGRGVEYYDLPTIHNLCGTSWLKDGYRIQHADPRHHPELPVSIPTQRPDRDHELSEVSRRAANGRSRGARSCAALVHRWRCRGWTPWPLAMVRQGAGAHGLPVHAQRREPERLDPEGRRAPTSSCLQS